MVLTLVALCHRHIVQEVRILFAIIAAPSVVDVVLPDDELAVNVDVVGVLLAVQVVQFVTVTKVAV